MEQVFHATIVKAVLDKYADPIITRIAKFSKAEFEKFKVDFDIAFTAYLRNAYEKYCKIKTILYRTEPKYIYDFFEVPYLEIKRGERIKADDIDIITNISKYIIIQGTGGIGKSTLMKHLFISELKKKDLIPVFLELRDINDAPMEYQIEDLILTKLNCLGSSLSLQSLQYALKAGCFLFLLDGYDEILTDKRDVFFKKLDAFCDSYSDNYYVISSRPYSEFVEFQRFTVLKTLPLTKEQAVSLVSKIDFDFEIKSRFVAALNTQLFEKHKSFASNPLLLNIMLLTFDNYAEIPEKLHVFYSNAFETLYSKHDATKAGFRREIYCKLSYDSFRRVFSYFCFITYTQGKLEFSYDELISVLSRIELPQMTFSKTEYIKDLVNSLCVLYRDGLNYCFAHRSFQEYFTAVFLMNLSDELMKKFSWEIIKRDYYRAAHDDVFLMLRDMTDERFENNVLLPILVRTEKKSTSSNKYDFYFKKQVQHIGYELVKSTDSTPSLWWRREALDSLDEFIFRCGRLYVKKDQSSNKKIADAEKKLYQYLCENRNYTIGNPISYSEMFDDKKMYNLIRKTWIGETVCTMANLCEYIRNRKRETKIDLSQLIS